MCLADGKCYLAVGLSMVVVSFWVGVLPARADEPLRGNVEQSQLLPGADVPAPPTEWPAPVVTPKPGQPLRGGVEQSALKGGAQGSGLTGGVEGGGWQGNAQQGRMDQWRPVPMQGGAAQNPMSLDIANDPDAGSQELLIEWDRWRNTLMQAIQMGALAKINVHNEINFVWDPRQNMMVSRYPTGISAWYVCDVLPDRRIVNVRLTQSSGYPAFDQAVLHAISDLTGNGILQYPMGSKRRVVRQESSVRTAGQSQSQNYQWGDVERQRY